MRYFKRKLLYPPNAKKADTKSVRGLHHEYVEHLKAIRSKLPEAVWELACLAFHDIIRFCCGRMKSEYRLMMSRSTLTTTLRFLHEQEAIVLRGILFLAILIVFAPAGVVGQQFALKDINGSTVRLRDYRGKVVLINFWATWCPPCRAEMPDLVRHQRDYAKQGLQIIGITYPPEEKNRVRRFARSLKVNYPIILGTRQIKARFSSEETLPLTVVIDRDGKVNDIISGILLPEEFDEKIKPLLMKTTEGEMRHGKSDH